MDGSNAIIEIEGLCRQFRFTPFFENLNLRVFPGRIVGLLGDNGAGKTTLLRHITGLYLPEQGRCLTMGKDAGGLDSADLQQVGYIQQENQYPDWIRAGQLIRYVRSHYDNWNYQLEEAFVDNFEIDRDKSVKSMSPGQCQRLSILLGVCFEPRLLILDEPVNAMDPAGRSELYELLLELMSDDPERTIIISSHILEDIEKTVDETIIMDKGAIARHCELDELRESFCRLRLISMDGPLKLPLPFEGVIEVQQQGDEAQLILADCDEETIKYHAQRMKCQWQIQRLSLEQIYRIIVGRWGRKWQRKAQ